MTAVSHDIASLESLKVVMPEHLHEPEMLEASPPNHSGSGVKLSPLSSQYRLLSIQPQSSESRHRMPSSMRHLFQSSKVPLSLSSGPFWRCSNNLRSREGCKVEYTVFQPILAAISAECPH